MFVESGILGSGIQNPSFGIQDPAKKGIQNPLAENPFQIILAAFTRIHATTVECSSLTCQSLLKVSFQIPQDLLGTSIWPLFDCFGTPLNNDMAARTSYEINLLIVITTVGRLFNFFFFWKVTL